MNKAWAVFLFLAVLTAGCQEKSPTIPCPFDPQAFDLEGNVDFRVENRACTSICRLYLSSPECGDWGFDLLNDQTLPHGEAFAASVPPGTYDVLIEECTQDATEVDGVDLSAGVTWTYGLEGVEADAPCEASLMVVNQGAVPICHLWIAGPASESFGYDWIRGEPIPAGEMRSLAVLPGEYDLKAEDC